MSRPRVTKAVLAILVALRVDPSTPRYGFDIARAASLSHTTIYDTLARLEAAKWISSEWEVLDAAEEGRPRRRLYRLTAEGDAVAREEIDAQFQMLSSVRGPLGAGRLKPSL